MFLRETHFELHSGVIIIKRFHCARRVGTSDRTRRRRRRRHVIIMLSSSALYNDIPGHD